MCVCMDLHISISWLPVALDRFRVEADRHQCAYLFGAGARRFNDGSATTRKNARVFFEAHINEQIGKEEPNAPHISIFDRDGDNKAKQRGLKPSSCPPVEHFYTNRLI